MFNPYLKTTSSNKTALTTSHLSYSPTSVLQSIQSRRFTSYTYNAKTLPTAMSTRWPIQQNIFRPTQIARDWHQKLDHKTGKFYYVNIFSGERSEKQPAMFLPHDAPQESAALRILRNDGMSPSPHAKNKSVLRPLIWVAVIASSLYLLEKYGYLEKWFLGVDKKPLPVNIDEDIRLRVMQLRQEHANKYRQD